MVALVLSASHGGNVWKMLDIGLLLVGDLKRWWSNALVEANGRLSTACSDRSRLTDPLMCRCSLIVRCEMKKVDGNDLRVGSQS